MTFPARFYILTQKNQEFSHNLLPHVFSAFRGASGLCYPSHLHWIFEFSIPLPLLLLSQIPHCFPLFLLFYSNTAKVCDLYSLNEYKTFISSTLLIGLYFFKRAIKTFHLLLNYERVHCFYSPTMKFITTESRIGSFFLTPVCIIYRAQRSKTIVFFFLISPKLLLHLNV